MAYILNVTHGRSVSWVGLQRISHGLYSFRVGNGLLVIAKFPICTFGYAIGLLSSSVPPSYSSSPNILSAQRFHRDEKGKQLKSMTIRKLKMNAPLQPTYTNKVSPEFLCRLDDSPFTEEQLAGFNNEVMAIIHQQQAYAEAHPPRAIYRVATQGSQTRDGGVIQQAAAPLVFTLDNGQKVTAAQKGDYVVYADGDTAQIVTGAGEGNNDLALVGSRLCNGDEIINTLQGSYLFIRREGVSLAEDFLPSIEGAATNE
jgi:hypothetical protein